MNIATSTVTIASLFPPLQSFHVRTGYTKNGSARDKITYNADFSKILSYSEAKLHDNEGDGRKILAISIIKEWLHLCSDVNSKDSLPIPLVPLLASPELAIEIAKYGLDVLNIKTVSEQIGLASFINYLIAMLHRLILDNNGGRSPLLYEVRTRKILSYSNIIATTSNILLVSISALVGAKTGNKELIKKSISYLDIGGLLVTIYRLISDTKFISDIKQEFLEKEFYKTVMGDEFDF